MINSVSSLNEGTANEDIISLCFTGYTGPTRVTRTHVCVSKKAKRTNQNKKRINYTKKQVAAASAVSREEADAALDADEMEMEIKINAGREMNELRAEASVERGGVGGGRGAAGESGRRGGIVNLCDLWGPHAQSAPPSPKD